MRKRTLFVLAAVILAGAGLYIRSQNAKEAQNRESQIVEQDLAGADTAASVAALKSYVNGHMGASADFTLTGAFDKAQAAAEASAAAQAASSKVYADAQKACAGRSDSVTQARCNQEYIQKNLTSVPVSTPVAAPQIADYEHSLKAPVWTPDLAGALFLGAAASLGLGFIGARRREH